MKSFIVFALFVAAAVAAPASPEAGAETVVYKADNIGTGTFDSVIETSNGIKTQTRGELKNVGTENEAQEVTGQFSYPGPDGVVYTVTYVANENGFQASGAHLPQVPQ